MPSYLDGPGDAPEEPASASDPFALDDPAGSFDPTAPFGAGPRAASAASYPPFGADPGDAGDRTFSPDPGFRSGQTFSTDPTYGSESSYGGGRTFSSDPGDGAGQFYSSDLGYGSGQSYSSDPGYGSDTGTSFGFDDAGEAGYSADGSYSSGAASVPAAAAGIGASEPGPTIRVSVAVVEPQPAIRDRIMVLLGEGGTPFSSIEELAARLTGSVPVVVILGPSCANPSDLALAERLVNAHDNLGAILVVEELTTTLLQHALRSGVKDVLTLHGDASQITQAVQRVAIALDSSPRRPTSPDEPPVSESSDGPLGQVITVFSTKGGAGKSVISTNLAITLAQRSGQPVCLVDADLQFGDVAVMLKLTPHHTIVDAVNAIDRMDSALLESLLVTHEASGLRVLPAPLEPAFADQVGAAEMVSIVEQLRTFCSYVVVDTPAYFNDVVLGLVEVSDKVVLVAGMDIPNIKNVKIGLQTLRLLNTPMEKLLLVLNRSNSKVKLDIGEVERTLQVKADALVPSDVLIPQSVNKGVPVVLHAPKSPVARSIREMADIFLPQPAAAPKRK